VTGALAALSDEDRALLVRRPGPRSLEPMKATLTDQRFSDPNWIYEPKLDGVRCAALRAGKSVRLVSRTGRELGQSYPELEEALGRDDCDEFVADGEIVAFAGGVTSFSRLQGRMQIADRARARRTGIAVFLYLFDLVHLEGYDTRRLPLRTRKALLRRALTFEGPVGFTPHRNEAGEDFYREACRKGWEGVIAKRADSRYSSSRSSDWLKFKCSNQQEFVVGGFTEPKGSRHGFGALLIGYHQDGELRYAGKVGTGFDEGTLADLGRRLRAIERETPPYADVARVPGAHWVRPELVAQIGFSEWTRDGRLRHPRFLGLRDDKSPSDVVREEPAAR
jgi:bifunctional non-homologous end joining protein LigD